jgi:predicted negative regulator of RcsB-dependent stress response
MADPTLTVAALHRGMVVTGMRRYAEAMGDLETALANGAEPAVVHYQIALVQVARQDRQAALKGLDRSLEHDGAYAPAAALNSRLEELR